MDLVVKWSSREMVPTKRGDAKVEESIAEVSRTVAADFIRFSRGGIGLATGDRRHAVVAAE